ncbi:MAG: hypothetical protein KJO06_02290 [Gemmatimonadetes bacterium]|nr:hypothetical protein [Gemmatimonadota bacterium]NNK48509.1 hypothetical protein [Gemmatimonadota bacterium]
MVHGRLDRGGKWSACMAEDSHRGESCRETIPPVGHGGFALVAVLVLLAALYVASTGIFLAARAELRIGVNHAASSQAFYLAESGLATWLASPVQPSAAQYTIAGETVAVRATKLLTLDSVTVLYRIAAKSSLGGGHTGNPGVASRETSVLGLRIGSGRVSAIRSTWSEVL